MSELLPSIDPIAVFIDGPWWLTSIAKLTVLLATAWLLHFLLTKANPRWRVLLWRSLAVAMLIVPVTDISTDSRDNSFGASLCDSTASLSRSN